MTLWLRVRRARACAATILAVTVAVALAGDWYLPLPNLLGGPRLAVPFATLIPLAVAIVVAWGLTAGDPLAEAVASRPLRLLDGAYALAAANLTLASCALARALGETDLALAAGRNALGYVGLALIGRRLLGPHAAAALAVGFVLVATLFGGGPDQQPRRWAWPLAAPDDALSWGIAAVFLLLGTAVALMRGEATAAER